MYARIVLRRLPKQENPCNPQKRTIFAAEEVFAVDTVEPLFEDFAVCKRYFYSSAFSNGWDGTTLFFFGPIRFHEENTGTYPYQMESRGLLFFSVGWIFGCG